MDKAGSNREVEIKLAVPDAKWARRFLARHGFRVVRRRVLQDDVVFDDAQGTLAGADALLRLRRSGRKAALTYKGPAAPGRHKAREELETVLDLAQADGIEKILRRLGYRPAFRYQKYRTEFARPADRGLVALDETPIGVFLELEGSPGWIDRTARELGFATDRYITATYAELYYAECRRRGRRPGDMVFPASRKH